MHRVGRVSVVVWLLMVFDEYAYGDHVSDPQAFISRWRIVRVFFFEV